MIEAKEKLNKLVSQFRTSFPDRTVKAIYGYKNKQLLIEAPLKNDTYENAFFLLSKSGISAFSPFDDFEGFCEALDKHKVKV